MYGICIYFFIYTLIRQKHKLNISTTILNWILFSNETFFVLSEHCTGHVSFPSVDIAFLRQRRFFLLIICWLSHWHTQAVFRHELHMKQATGDCPSQTRSQNIRKAGRWRLNRASTRSPWIFRIISCCVLTWADSDIFRGEFCEGAGRKRSEEWAAQQLRPFAFSHTGRRGNFSGKCLDFRACLKAA